MTQASDWILVALGANLGDPGSQLRDARVELESRFAASCAVSAASADVRASSLWCSRPLDCPPDSPDFLNAVLAFPITVAASAEAMLSVLQELERTFGRGGRGLNARRNAPRTLDLDLLLFGDLIQAHPTCMLPHPRALRRRFVVEPAAEILPDLIWPGTSNSVAECREALRDDPAQAGIRRASRQW